MKLGKDYVCAVAPLFPCFRPSHVQDFTSCLFQFEHKSTPVYPLELIHVQKIFQSSTRVISGLIHIIDSFLLFFQELTLTE